MMCPCRRLMLPDKTLTSQPSPPASQSIRRGSKVSLELIPVYSVTLSDSEVRRTGDLPPGTVFAGH